MQPSVTDAFTILDKKTFDEMLQEIAAKYPPTEENIRADLLLMQRSIIPRFDEPVSYAPGKTQGDLFWLEDECRDECVFDWIIEDLNSKHGLQLSKPALMREANDIAMDDIMRAKDYFAKPRPIVTRDLLQIPIQAFDVASARSPALPSGHAIQAMMVGCIIYRDHKGVLTPDDVRGLAQRCADVGWRRVVGGVHYPSDVLGGIVFVRYATQGFNVDELLDMYEQFAWVNAVS